jgi:hypothetical protein
MFTIGQSSIATRAVWSGALATNLFEKILWSLFRPSFLSRRRIWPSGNWGKCPRYDTKRVLGGSASITTRARQYVACRTPALVFHSNSKQCSCRKIVPAGRSSQASQLMLRWGAIGAIFSARSIEHDGKQRRLCPAFASSMCHPHLKKRTKPPGLTLGGFVGLPMSQTIYTACEGGFFIVGKFLPLNAKDQCSR